jgi:S-adenosylmethionine hydrolase
MRHTAIWACPYSKSSFNPMTLITLLTDFGTRDEYVGVMKGVIAGINPDVRIVDISHHIDPQDIVHGAFILAAAAPYFPDGTVHVAVVDPGVGSSRRILAVECGRQRFVAPDNGLLERIMAHHQVSEAVSVTDPRYFLDRVSCTFHGRDIFAPVAARLAAGLSLRELGPVVDRQSIVCGVIPRCRFSSQDCIDGAVVAADRFGNLMTTIDAAALDRLRRRTGGKPIVVELSGKAVGGLVASYDRVPEGSLLALIGSRGLLEISVNCGNARQVLNAQKYEAVRVRSA